MREIKFRGLHSSGWIYGNLITDEYDRKITMIQEQNSCSDVDSIYQSVVVDAKTLGQFTGLKDKASNDIYEHDIVSFNNIEWVIVWDESAACFLYEMISNSGAYEGLDEFAGYCFVIGNAHQNQELLK